MRCWPAILAVFLVLLVIRRRVRLAAVPLIPIALATGWSAALLFLLRIPLNPMSAALGALVIAISTEFSVLLSARYQEEREAGWSRARHSSEPTARRAPRCSRRARPRSRGSQR
jgi:predicted RND superfamily exporter protein